MKRILLVSLLALLSSCALIDAYRMARFDNNEYMLVNNLHTIAVVGAEKCGTKDAKFVVEQAYFKSAELKAYSASIPRNEETVKMSVALHEIVKGLKDRYATGEDVSDKYCELKFSNIQKATTTMQKSIGDKPR